MDEEWEKIESFPDYEVSTRGRVRRIDSGSYVKVQTNQNGTRNAKVYLDDTQYSRAIDLLVAEAFLEKHPMEAFNASVIHLDGDLGNCHIDNLMWRPRWFKMAYQKQFRKNGPTIKFPIYCVDTDELFESSRAASMAHGVLDVDVVKCISDDQVIVWPHGYVYELHRE